MNISTSILVCSDSDLTSHILATHPYSLWYKVFPIIILVDVSDVTFDNDSVKSNPKAFVCP